MDATIRDQCGIPASESQIADIESWFGATLPESYRSFLKAFGNGDAPIETSVISYEISRLREIRATAYETVRRAQSPYLWRDEDFVFACDYDGQFLMFRTTGDPDPEVLSFPEGSVNPIPLEIPFSKWLDDTITEHLG